MISVTDWPTSDRLSLWNTLKEGVARGEAGWVVLMLDLQSSSSPPIELVKVFCWGRAVAHIWILVYIMSGKRTKHGMIWRDSQGMIVVEV